ncbi:hypothetical protein CsSME_00052031 [Camellia sinensis var. sinensis]
MGDNSINSRGSTTSETQTSRTTSIISSNGLEGSSVQLSAEKLNGKNFREWAQSVKLAVDGRGKLGYLTGDSQKPESTDAVAVQRWRSENSLITSWLINSMKPTIGKTYIKKQNVVARSSAEAEFRAVAQGICEGLWLRRILEELHAELELPVKLYCDNKAAINISLNPVQHDRTKHVEVDRHFIKEKVEEGTICMTYVPTKEQIADTFTKGLSRQLFEDFIGKLDMINIYDPT